MSIQAEYEFDGFKTGGMRARSVDTTTSDADIADYVPKLDYLLVDIDGEKQNKSAGGVILPDTAVKERVEGRVVAAGPGNHQNGVFIPNRVSVGEWVRFGAWAAEPARRIEVAGKVYALMREEDVLMSRPSKFKAPGITRETYYVDGTRDKV